jgi:hypothetical protein
VAAAGGEHYGKDLSIEVQACKQYETLLCSSDWSRPQDLGIAVNNSALGGRNFVVTGDALVPPFTAQYQWLTSPMGAYDSVTYSCDGGATQSTAKPDVPNECTVHSDITGVGYPPLTVTITVNGITYPRTYDSLNF